MYLHLDFQHRTTPNSFIIHSVTAELFHRDTDIHYKQYLERLLQIYLKTNQNRHVEIFMLLKMMICGNACGDSDAVVCACRSWESRGSS